MAWPTRYRKAPLRHGIMPHVWGQDFFDWSRRGGKRCPGFLKEGQWQLVERSEKAVGSSQAVRQRDVGQGKGGERRKRQLATSGSHGLRANTGNRLIFSACSYGDSYESPFGVPEHHEPLLPGVADHIDSGTLTPNDFCSYGVTVASGGLDVFASEPAGTADVSFSCPRQCGAVLSLPVTAQREDTIARGDFAKWIIRHIDSWFAFTRRLGLGVDKMGDIVLVTGRHRTRSWTNVAFYESRAIAQASFGVQITNDDVSASVNWQVSREHIQGAMLSQGPSGADLPEDQCIFVRGYRVARTFKLFPRLRGAGGPTADPSGHDSDPELEVVPLPSFSKYKDPLHVLSEYIAERAPGCDFVLVHDDDLSRIRGISDGTSPGSLQPDAVVPGTGRWLCSPKSPGVGVGFFISQRQHRLPGGGQSLAQSYIGSVVWRMASNSPSVLRMEMTLFLLLETPGLSLPGGIEEFPGGDETLLGGNELLGDSEELLGINRGSSSYNSSTSHRNFKNIGRAYREQATTLIEICRLYAETCPQTYAENDGLQNILRLADAALSAAGRAKKGTTTEATEAFARFHEETKRFGPPSSRKGAPGGHRKKLFDPSTTLESASKKDIKGVTEEIDNSTTTAEIVWRFSRYPEERTNSERITPKIASRQNPHFYLRLPKDAASFDSKFHKDPLKDLAHGLQHGDKIYVLLDKSCHLFLDAHVPRIFGNLWKPHHTVIMKDIVLRNIGTEQDYWHRPSQPRGQSGYSGSDSEIVEKPVRNGRALVDAALRSQKVDLMIRDQSRPEPPADSGWKLLPPPDPSVRAQEPVDTVSYTSEGSLFIPAAVGKRPNSKNDLHMELPTSFSTPLSPARPATLTIPSPSPGKDRELLSAPPVRKREAPGNWFQKYIYDYASESWRPREL
ncbi:hypothetical protein EDB89DRAFT_1908133 [Lactarius sanguifluus]|nr:hypothetical protein EDB89DRAFT_1908133 [Lactarius sanguifluus]